MSRNKSSRARKRKPAGNDGPAPGTMTAVQEPTDGVDAYESGFGVRTGPIGTFVVLITVARPCGSRRVGLSFLSRGK